MSGKKKPASPAQVLREQKAVIEAASKVEPPRLSGVRHPASDAAEALGKARQRIGALQVPMTLATVCEIIGTDCSADNFASTSLSTLASQLDAVSGFAEKDTGGSYDCYTVVQNIVARMNLASEIVTWLESETTELPEVTS